MVTSSYPKKPGDVTAPFVESIARGVAARGHEVDVVLPEHPDLDRSADTTIRFFPYRYAPTPSWTVWGYAQSLESDVSVRRSAYLVAPFAALGLRRELSARLQDTRYDVVHAHWVVPNAALVTDIVRSHGVGFVISLHGSDVFLAERLRPARSLAAASFRAAGAVTACSDDLRSRAVALGAPADRIRTVPYGVDAADFAEAEPDPSLRARAGAGPGDLFVLAVGRLVEKKGFTHLVEAAARVPGVVVAIAGDGDLRAPLQAQAERLGARVTLLGALDRAALARAMATADVVAVPSVIDHAGNVDGLPNVLLEALGAGRALVASRVAGIPDVVADDQSGLLVPPGDVAALADALARLHRDEPLRTRLGAEARRHAREDLSWETAARSFEECYVRATAVPAR